LCNARHIKKVPGRKTDLSDAEWLVQVDGGQLRVAYLDALGLAHSRHDIVDRWVCVVVASTSFPGSAVNAPAAKPSPEGEV
jgi:hypothetical protein